MYVGLGQNGRLFTLKVYIGLFYIFHLIVCKKNVILCEAETKFN